MLEGQKNAELLKNLIRKNYSELPEEEMAKLVERYTSLGKLFLEMWLKKIYKKSRDPPV